MTALRHDFAAAALFASAFPIPEPGNKDGSPKTIFFGTGLVTPRAMSAGLPFDFLSMIATAETLRRNDPDNTRIVHYIPDVTALQNEFATPDAIVQSANATEQTARAIAKFLGIGNSYDIVRGSSIESDPDRRDLIRRARDYTARQDIPDAYKGYMAEQLADMAYFYARRGGRVKMSWTMARNPQSAGRGLDESFFDSHFRQCFPGRDLQFAYIEPGRRLDGKANRACPYTRAPGEPRLSLTHDFSVAATIEKSGLDISGRTARDAIKHWDNIASALTHLFPHIAPENKNTANENTPARRVDSLRKSIGRAL